MLTKKKKIAIFAIAVAVICSVAWFLIYQNRVHGESKNYIAAEPAATDQPTINGIQITASGANTKPGTQGSLAEVCDKRVPTAGYLEKGESKNDKDVIKKNAKGGERNPFVILEIVPDKKMQQMSLLQGDDKTPVDWMKAGISTGKNFHSGNNIENDVSNAFGYWAMNYKYNVLKYGTDSTNPEYEEDTMASVAKLYQLAITNTEIEKAGYTVSDFDNKYNNGNGTLADLSSAFPKLFEKDDDDQEIRDIAIADNQNWKRSKKNAYSTIECGDKVPDEDINSMTMAELAAKYPNVFKEDSDGKQIKNADLDKQYWDVEKTTTTTTREIQTSALAIKDDVENTSVADLAAKYPDIFSTDKDGKKITPSMIADADNWKLETTNNSWETVDLKSQGGYLVYVGEGNGDYSFESSGNQWWFGGNVQKSSTDSENVWKYVTTLPDESKNNNFQDKDNYCDILNNKTYLQDSAYMNGYLDLSKLSWCQGKNFAKYYFKYSKSQNQYVFTCKKIEYKFEYYGLRANDVLKRSLFVFKDEEECKNFNIEVVCMTPSEINEIAKSDDADKLDMIERADLFYIETYDQNSVGLDRHFQFYQYVDPDYTYNASDVQSQNIKSFKQNDLEWASCIKLLKRLSVNSNLPLMYTKPVGSLLENSTFSDEAVTVHIGNWKKIGYDGVVSEDVENPTRTSPSSQPGSICNIAKMYLISMQFDLIAPTNINLHAQGGYLIYVGAGKGDYSFKSSGDQSRFGGTVQKSSTDSENAWRYVTNLPGGNKYFKDEERQKDGWKNFKDKDSYWEILNNQTYLNDVSYDNYYIDLSEISWCTADVDYQRTFFDNDEDIDSVIKHIYTVPLHSDVTDNTDEGSATTTGYYQTPTGSDAKSCYLWNRWTFFPYEETPNDITGVPVETGTLMKYGYLTSYLATNAISDGDNNTDDGHFDHQDGTDGKKNDNNVTVVRGYGGSSNVNESTLNGLTQNTIMNTMMDILYRIMNNRANTNPYDMTALIQKCKKQYTKVSDSAALYDYSSEGKYTDKTLYLKVAVYNGDPIDVNKRNNEAGAITSIELVNEDGDAWKDELVPQEKLGDTSTNLKKETIASRDQKASNSVYGYQIGDILNTDNYSKNIYIPFQLSAWQKGYNRIRIKTRARMFDEGKKTTTVQSSDHSIYLDLDERALFDLQ